MDGEKRGVARRLADGLEQQQRVMDELERKLNGQKATGESGWWGEVSLDWWEVVIGFCFLFLGVCVCVSIISVFIFGLVTVGEGEEVFWKDSKRP